MDRALSLLTDPTRRLRADAVAALEETPGIYAFWPADEHVANNLCLLGGRALGAPLYVGVARQSLRQRTQVHLDPIHVGRSEFHGQLGEWLSEVAEAIPWHPFYRLLQDDYGRGRRSSEYAETAQCRWMREALTVSAVECGTEAEARKLERPLIKATRPIFNDGIKALHRTTEPEALGGPFADSIAHRLHVRDTWRPWLVEYVGAIHAAGAGARLAVPCDEDGIPTGPPRLLGPGEELGRNEMGFFGCPASVARESLLAAEMCPEWWYSPPWRLFFDEPPPWPEIVADLSDAEAVRLHTEDAFIRWLDDAFPERIIIEFDGDESVVSGGTGLTDVQLRRAHAALDRAIEGVVEVSASDPRQRRSPGPAANP